MKLIKGKMMVGYEDVDVVPHVCIRVVYPNNSLCSNIDCYRSGCKDVHDVVQSELEGKILDEIQDLVGVLDRHGDSILFPPFRSLGDDMPPIITFLRLNLEYFVVVRVNVGVAATGTVELTMAVAIALVRSVTRIMKASEVMARSAAPLLPLF